MGSTATPEGALGYVREFTRHSSDVLGNLNVLVQHQYTLQALKEEE